MMIIPEDPGNLDLIKTFEKSHAKHTLITLDYEEIKGKFQPQEGTETKEAESS
jgi:hypothetical protein